MTDIQDPNPSSERKLMRRSGNTAGGGFFIAMFTLAGTIIGGLEGQPSIGLLSGLAIGVAIALALWLKDRSR